MEGELEGVANLSFRSDVSNRDLGLILGQISQLRADNAAEIRRVEQATERGRERDREAHQREKTFLTDTMVAIQQSIASLKPNNAPDPCATPASPTPGASTSRANTAGPSSPTKMTNVSLPPLSGGALPDMTLQGQPPTVDVTPEKLSASDHPIQFLRRDKPTSDVASIILQEVGLAKAIELVKAHKGKSSLKSANKLKARDVKWPNDYVYRLDSDEDPTYDSLSPTEFVSGYISIIAEVTPNIPQNAKLIQHLLYLRQLMDDVASAEWEQVRTAHRLVLMSIVHNRLDWNNAAAVKEEKAIALSRVHRKTDTQSHKSVPKSNESPCQPFQKDTCLYSTDHTHDSHTALHCCAHCYKRTGRPFPHAQKECNRLNKSNRSKNGKQAAKDNKE